MLTYLISPTWSLPAARRTALVDAGSGADVDNAGPADVGRPPIAVNDKFAAAAGPVVGSPRREPAYAMRCHGPTVPALPNL